MLMWNMLNGRKTTIGMILVALVSLIRGLQTLVGGQLFDESFLTELNHIGVGLGTVGLGHKIVKSS